MSNESRESHIPFLRTRLYRSTELFVASQARRDLNKICVLDDTCTPSLHEAVGSQKYAHIICFSKYRYLKAKKLRNRSRKPNKLKRTTHDKNKDLFAN